MNSVNKFYISGPISKDPYAYKKFNYVEEQLASIGIEVVNPFKLLPSDHEGKPCPPGYTPGKPNYTKHTSSACFMKEDIRALLECEGIIMLPGWISSTGATVEYEVAKACGMVILEWINDFPSDVLSEPL